jgi:putative ABC transport system permease protein
MQFIPIKYNLRYLVSRWSSTLMTALTFALVVAIFIIIMSLARGIERALGTTGDPLNVLVLRQGVQAESQSAVTLEQYQIIRNFPGIARGPASQPLIAPEVLVLVNKPRTGSGKPSNLQIRGVHPQGIAARPEVRLVQGRWFRPGLREVVVSESVARRFAGMRIGDRPNLGQGRWEVVGLYDARDTAYDSEMWADYREIMQEFNREAYSTLFLRIDNPAAVDAIERRLDEDPRLKLVAKTEMEYYDEQTKVAGPMKAFASFLAVIMSIGACFAGMNTMYASVAGRVREIATLRILGFTPFSILVSFLLESITLATIGGVIGCLLSLPMNGIATGTTNFLSFSEVVFYFAITPELMLRGVIFAMLMGAIGGMLPALYAARQPILAALREV